MRLSVMQKNWFTIFNVKVTVKAYIIKIWLFLLHLLNHWSVCKQTWFDSTATWTYVSCGKVDHCVQRQGYSESSKYYRMFVQMQMILLVSWYFEPSQPQRVDADDIFWTTEHFVTKLGMVMQDHEPVCHGEKLVHSLHCHSHSKGFYLIKIWLFLLCQLNCRSVCNQSWLVNTASKAGVSFEKIGLLSSRSRSQWRLRMSECLSMWYLQNCKTFCYQTWYGGAALWARMLCGKN